MNLREEFEKETGITAEWPSYIGEPRGFGIKYVEWLESKCKELKGMVGARIMDVVTATKSDRFLCEAGCKTYTGGEVKHHPDCVYYPNSLSEQLDKLSHPVTEMVTDEIDSKNCSNCKFTDRGGFMEPCNSCRVNENWKPKQSEK